MIQHVQRSDEVERGGAPGSREIRYERVARDVPLEKREVRVAWPQEVDRAVADVQPGQVTDTGAPPEFIAALRERGIRVLAV